MHWIPQHRRRGSAILFGMVILAVLIAFASLAVDLGRVQLAKTELRQAADAAARFAVRGLEDGTWKDRATTAAKENKIDGAALALASTDVIHGNWNATATPKFSTSRAPINAVQVIAQRTADRGNAVPLWFGAMVGMKTCDIRSSAIATTLDFPAGFIGLNGFTVKNNLRSVGYDSSSTPNPTFETSTSAGMLGSNEFIEAKNNEIVGAVVLGKDATTNMSLSSPATTLTTDIPVPTVDFSGAPAINPNGLAKNLQVNSTLTLPGGSYHFTSIDCKNNADLHFSGPATVYIDGNVNFSQNNGVFAYNNIPSNLRILIRGAGTYFGGTNANNITLVADITAPQTIFQVNNDASLYGAAVFSIIDVRNNAEFFYDVRINRMLGVSGGAIVLVQ